MNAWMGDSVAGGGEAVFDFGNVAEVKVGGFDIGVNLRSKGSNSTMFQFFITFLKSKVIFISVVENVAVKMKINIFYVRTSVSLQAAQTSALSDRHVEQRRILELDNAVKTVSEDTHPLTCCQRAFRPQRFHLPPVACVPSPAV